MKPLAFDGPNALCGAIFIALGGFFADQSLDLELGTAFRMGPGYFPLVLALILILLGVAILIQSVRIQGEKIGPVALRGMAFILPAPIVFGLTVRGLGLAPSLFLASLIAAFASNRVKPMTAVVLAASITIFSIAVFSYGLELPFQRIGPWLGN